MTLLELITNATSNPDPPASQSDYPIILNPDVALLNLKPDPDDPDVQSFIKPLKGWQISQHDSELIELNHSFHDKLKRKLKNPNSFNLDEFNFLFKSFLEKNAKKFGVSVRFDPKHRDYTRVLVEKVGFLIGRDVACLILESCVVLENWDLLETLIVNRVIDYSISLNLVTDLLKKGRLDLICVCIKCFSDFRLSDVTAILKYFLDPPSEGYGSMVSVRKEWESQACLAIEKASDHRLSDKDLRVAKDASMLLMVAYDGFSAWELCLHYLISSPNMLDPLVLSAVIRKLNGGEMLSLIRYLAKWLKKYERFPQVGPCSKRVSKLGLTAWKWVPSVEDIVKCVGLVIDEHFSSVVLHSEFHEELRSMAEVASALVLEAQLCLPVANVIENLRNVVEES